jgi:hypothetical protein
VHSRQVYTDVDRIIFFPILVTQVCLQPPLRVAPSSLIVQRFGMAAHEIDASEAF